MLRRSRVHEQQGRGCGRGPRESVGSPEGSAHITTRPPRHFTHTAGSPSYNWGAGPTYAETSLTKEATRRPSCRFQRWSWRELNSRPRRRPMGFFCREGGSTRKGVFVPGPSSRSLRRGVLKVWLGWYCLRHRSSDSFGRCTSLNFRNGVCVIGRRAGGSRQGAGCAGRMLRRRRWRRRCL